MSMTSIEKTIDVDAPISAVYNQWTQFEDFPQFMGGVESITQTDDSHLHWKVSIAGVEREFDAEITEQHADQRVAWKSIGTSTGDSPQHAGVVTFYRISDDTTRVTLQIDWQPEGFVEKAGALLTDRRPPGRERSGEVQGTHRGGGCRDRARGAATSTALRTPPVAETPDPRRQR